MVGNTHDSTIVLIGNSLNMNIEEAAWGGDKGM
jgi:hypothetical protein